MPIVQQVNESINSGGVISFTLTPPTSGNLLLAGVSLYNGNNSVVLPPVGWTTLNSMTNSIDNLNYGGLALYSKTSDGTETNVIFTDLSNGPVMGTVFELNGVSQIGLDNFAIMTSKQEPTPNQTTAQVTPSVIPQYMNDIPIAFFFMYDPSGNATPFSYPFSFGWNDDYGVLQQNNGIFGVADRSQTPTFMGDGGGVNCVMANNIGQNEVYWTSAMVLVTQSPPQNITLNTTDAFSTVDVVNYGLRYFVPPGNPGLDGTPGAGATLTVEPILIQPIGTNIRINVGDVRAFPKQSYILISDGIFSIVGNVIEQDVIDDILIIKIVSIINANLGSTIQSGATVTFSGPPGPASTIPELGVEGTVQYSRLLLSPASSYFNSNQGLTSASVLGTVTINLPGVLENGLAPNFSVNVELDCSLATNQLLVSNQAYVGIATSQQPLPGTGTQIFAGYLSPPQAAAMIPNTTCVADASVNVNYPSIPGNPGHAFFCGTYPANSNPAFSILATCAAPNTTFYVSANLKITAYPIYD